MDQEGKHALTVADCPGQRSPPFLFPGALGIDGETGTIEVGKSANLVMLDSNPIEAIRAIRTVHATMKRGRLYPRWEYEQSRKK